MIFAPIAEYFKLITSAYKVAFLTMLIASVFGYIGYLNVKVILAERNVVYYKSVVEAYKVSVNQMKQRLDYERSSAQKIKDYYESLDCVVRKKGPLTDEELTGRPKIPEPVPVPKKKPFWQEFF
jgi:hypothetical protein